MAKRRDGNEGKLIAPALQQENNDDQKSEDVNMDCPDGGDELSLEEILMLYSQPINEEQAWAVCYQCCRALAQGSRRRNPRSAGASGGQARIEGPANVKIGRDGTVRLQHTERGTSGKSRSPCTSSEVIESLGIMIYKALDYGLKENEERELSPPLEQLIDCMTNIAEEEGDTCPDEGYDATEEEDEVEEDAGEVSSVRGYRDVLKLCSTHLPSPSDAPNHYQAVCRALYAETKELRTFLQKIKSAKENLRKMEGATEEEPTRDLNDLQNADWARFWVQVMRDLRTGVKLKKVQERQYNPLPFEFELTPYEMLMDDIRFRRYTLRKVMVNGDIPPKLKKSAHEVILEFIRSRPPLNPVAERKLKPHPPRPRSLHERILEEIKAERKLRPVSPDEIRRSRLDVSTPDAPRKAGGKGLANGALPAQKRNGMGGAQSMTQRKRLLKAPTLAEMDSSDSEEETTRRSASSSSMSTSQVEDTSPESALGKKTPPKFLPISSTPQPERRQQPQRRHSIEKETPTNVRQFMPPTRQSSKSLEEFCYPVECLALTVEEVMHIRQVLVKAELEKFQQYKDVYNALKKGKLCFCCRTKRFSFFTWSYTCQFCKRPVCSQCCKKMRLPSKPYANLPIYSLGSTTLPKEEAGPRAEKPSTSHHRHHSLHRTVSRFTKSVEKSKEEVELPKELTEDWSAMEVCVDCKKFISEIISSSKRSLSLATKRARLKRKTQSFYMSSPNAAEYRPSERTIKEV
ncbi:protein spire homolog 1 [Amia ocellicauda]|uniref:protein spire homolog 1 n=1 Tax=Amia ocellicauda TaxID=2972642 RepID=UPI0034641369